MKNEIFFRIALSVAGAINMLPGLLAILPHRISKSYGITVPDVNYELLLRHRATFFAFIGGLMLYAAIAKKLYDVAAVAGLFSMLSFILLYLLIGPGINDALRKVMWIDVAATVLLLGGFLWFKIGQRG